MMLDAGFIVIPITKRKKVCIEFNYFQGAGLYHCHGLLQNTNIYAHYVWRVLNLHGSDYNVSI